MLRFPWQRSPAPPPVDVATLARTAAEEAVEHMATELRSFFPSPLSPVGGKAPAIYAFDQPWQYYTPQAPLRRPGSYVTIDTLRRLAAGYDILRSCIQHLKREVAAVPGKITPRDAKDESAATLRAIKDAEEFFGSDGGLGGYGRRRSHFESETLEDLLVIGAAAVYFEPTRGGGLYEVKTIDSATIRPRTDAYGWPGPGEIAYEQWIYGVRVGEGYTRDQLLYDGLNPVSYSPYFLSPVEWLVNIVNGALRADGWNLAWLTDGTTPADILALPQEWNPEQIKTFAAWWDGMLSGNSRQRQKTRFVPGGSQRVGSPSRKDQDFQEYELWLMRRTCGIFGVAPAAIGFAGEQYKVSQEGALAAGTQFGAGQILEFRKHLYDYILRRLGLEFLEWVDVTDQEEDAKERAERNQILVAAGIKTPNEARTDEGLDPDPSGGVLLMAGTMVPLARLLKEPEPTTPKPAATQETQGGAATPAANEQRADLLKWRQKVLNRLAAGKSATCAFESAAIPGELEVEVRAALQRCETADDVRAVFVEWVEA